MFDGAGTVKRPVIYSDSVILLDAATSHDRNHNLLFAATPPTESAVFAAPLRRDLHRLPKAL
jgi:hypothetical protein